jgi:C4-dicarboxylate-specific signal transduction histidine kinase
MTLENRVKEELKKREKQQQLLIQKSKLESMGELSAGMAHEINQPLGSISMGLDNMLFKLSVDGMDKEYLIKKINALFDDIDRIRQIINHVRVFSRDQQVAATEVVNVKDVIKNALSLVKVQYANHNVEIELNLDKNECKTDGNKYRLEQIILNLLSNAKFAVDEKQAMLNDIEFRKVIKINSYSDENNIHIEIIDNGTGISPETQENIFDPFFTTKDVENGTGLGLSITYGIVKEMKGEINVESELNKYTKMTIVLPKHKNIKEVANL